MIGTLFPHPICSTTTSSTRSNVVKISSTIVMNKYWILIFTNHQHIFISESNVGTYHYYCCYLLLLLTINLPYRHNTGMFMSTPPSAFSLSVLLLSVTLFIIMKWNKRIKTGNLLGTDSTSIRKCKQHSSLFFY